MKNYAVISKHVTEGSNGLEEDQDESGETNCSESLLTNQPSTDDEQSQNARMPKLSPETEGIILKDCHETNRDAIIKEESERSKVTKAKESVQSSGDVHEASTNPDICTFPHGEEASQDCSVVNNSSENLLGSNHRREPSVEDSDEVFPLVRQNANSSDDLLDKNFVKWTNEKNSHGSTNLEKGSALSSESPSSDVEFSACSSVTSCTEDSGISSTVRDEELEEIPLNNSQFSPDLYQQISRFAIDETVAAWIPKSSNTYAPSPSSSMKTVPVTDQEKSQKQGKLKGLFSKSTQKEPVPGWKLFGKVPAKDARDNNKDSHFQSSSFDRGDLKRSSFGDKPSSTTPTSKPKFLSIRRKVTTGSSTTALIFENRPSNLPAKSPTEEKKHRKQYEAMVAEAKKKELKDLKLQEKKLKEKCKQEDGIVSAASVWTNEILPNWETMQHAKKTRELWWQGLPPSVRGKVWKLAIGNDLHITQELFDIFQSHAYEKLFTTRLNKQKNVTQTVAELPASDHPVVSKAHTVELIVMDVSRTFPSLCIFQEGGPFHDVLHSILGAYTCYRPDVGYVQGMSFLAAVLLLNMEPSDAFICFANLLNKPCQLAFFRVDHPMMVAYFAAFQIFLEEFLPSVHAHFIEENFTPDMYLIDWTFTLFSKSLPLDIASRVWDVFCRDGEEFLFRAALGILKFYQDELLEMDFIHLGQFLSKLPDDIPAGSLFQAISSINLVEQKFSQTLAMQKEVAAQIKSVTSSTK